MGRNQESPFVKIAVILISWLNNDSWCFAIDLMLSFQSIVGVGIVRCQDRLITEDFRV